MKTRYSFPFLAAFAFGAAAAEVAPPAAPPAASAPAVAPAEAAEGAREMPAAFDRYRTILERMPFGEPPPGFDPNLSPTKAAAGANGVRGGAGANGGAGGEVPLSEQEQQLAGAVRVSAICVSPVGVTYVGFTDSSQQPPDNYYLAVGKSKNGWTVKSADGAAETAVLDKNGVEVTLKLGEGGANDKGKGKNGGAAARPGRVVAAPAAANGAPAAAHAAPGGLGSVGALGRLRARRMEKAAEDAERKRAEAAEREQRKAEQEAEREQRKAEREEQRAQLLAIQEELRRSREERAQQEKPAAEGGNGETQE